MNLACNWYDLKVDASTNYKKFSCGIFGVNERPKYVTCHIGQNMGLVENVHQQQEYFLARKEKGV